MNKQTAMSSKMIGSDADYFANIAVDACNAIKTEVDGKTKCNINGINILKSQGRSGTESILVKGFALNCTRASQQMPK